MSRAWLLARRELSAYARSPLGYAVAAAALLIEGLYFYAVGLGNGAKLSAEVLGLFFQGTAGVTMIIAVLLTMRLFAGEREAGTLVLLNTSPMKESEIVAGKFIAGFLFLAGTILLSLYMPALILVNGKIAVGQIAVGYLGLFLLAAASLSIGLFASAIADHQVVAAILAGVILGTLFLLVFVAPVTDEPIRGVIRGLMIFHERQRYFMNGVLRFENVVFYLAVAYFFLLGTTKTLEARRWR